MTILVSTVREVETGDVVYVDVATDNGVTRFTRDGKNEDISDQYVDEGEEAPTSAQDWLTLILSKGGHGLDDDEPYEAPSLGQAKKIFAPGLDAPLTPDLSDSTVNPSEHEFNAQYASGEAQIDSPSLLEDAEDGDFDQDSFANMVAMSLGDIDLKGPNAWFLDAMDGKEVPDDSYLHFGPPASESEMIDPDAQQETPVEDATEGGEQTEAPPQETDEGAPE